MRSFRVLIGIILIVSVLSACTPFEIEGIENYNKSTCSVGLTANLFPSDCFLAEFDYVKSKYHYIDKEDWAWGYAKVFACLTYDPEVYADAKKYCLDTFLLSEEHSYIYNGYCFAEHICYKSKSSSGEWVLESDYPKRFNMFGYHDESCTLFFVGYYNGDPNDAEKKLALSDFPIFIQEVYKEYYDFK